MAFKYRLTAKYSGQQDCISKGDNSVKIVISFLKRGPFPLGANSFFRVDIISEGAWCAGKQSGSHKKVVSLIKYDGN